MRVDTDVSRPILPDAPEDQRALIAGGGVAAWREPLVIPTYEPADPDRYPMFLDRRVYQGSSGRTYPLPFIDRIASEPVAHEWDAFHLENEYVRLVVLPELGGRIYIGHDKTNGYDFFYRNNVIKPALVGLAGPWVSGGVEFNWPQHHRPATYLPTEAVLERADDGSAVVWCSDHDPFQRMRETHGIRLLPGRSLVQLDVRLHNRTSEKQTFLWWANVAARVHDDYQSFFPTDVHYVADHARRAITAFPAADRPYYGVDYPARAAKQPGADRIDFYRNIPVPTSYMITGTQDDFFGGYDHRARAGFVHWADHHIAPGKKQWTWGNAPFGHAWDSHLTDADGPYVELMAGVFTDNQPDFSYLLPGETKAFSQFWYPIREIGVGHQANTDAAVHLEAGDAGATVGVAVTRALPRARVSLVDTARGTRQDWVADLGPEAPLVALADDLAGVPADRLRLTVEHDGHEVITWQARAITDAAEPATAIEPAPPTEVATVDELYLIGVHLEQYRHPTRSPMPYWREALRRDPGEHRSHLAIAQRLLRASDYAGALEHAQAAVARVTALNANPPHADGYYVLGLVLRRLGRLDDAYDAFAKAAWDGGLAFASLFERARIDAALGRLQAAESATARLIQLDPAAPRTRALRLSVLRRLGRSGEARELLDAGLARDPLDQLGRVMAEQEPTRDGRTLIDVALDLASFGEVDLASAVLDQAAQARTTAAGNVRPIAHYQRALVLEASGRADEAATARRLAREAERSLAFPFGNDDHDALVRALEHDPGDEVAHALLGLLLYDAGRHLEALAHLRLAIDGGLVDAVVLRTAGIAAYNDAHDDDEAWRLYERALACDPGSARLWYESDQLAARLGSTAQERLARLEPRLELVLSRDDLAVEYSELLIAAGRPREAVELLSSRSFQPWEGGEGKALAAWDRARAEAGLDPADPPATLGEARLTAAVPQAVRADGTTDYFATSLPELLLFHRD
jgi:tetratricopeptide (TPR) repeat protein